MRRLIRRQDLVQTFLDITKKNDKEILEICYEVAQYRVNKHFEKAKQVKERLDAYTGLLLYKLNSTLTMIALFLFWFLQKAKQVELKKFLLLWLLIFIMHSWVALKHYRQSLPYICVDELFSRKLLRAEKELK